MGLTYTSGLPVTLLLAYLSDGSNLHIWATSNITVSLFVMCIICSSGLLVTFTGLELKMTLIFWLQLPHNNDITLACLTTAVQPGFLCNNETITFSIIFGCNKINGQKQQNTPIWQCVPQILKEDEFFAPAKLWET